MFAGEFLGEPQLLAGLRQAVQEKGAGNGQQLRNLRVRQPVGHGVR